MDKALFIGTSGAKNTMHELEIITNNLANVNTTGFRADFDVVKQYNPNNQDDDSREYSTLDKTYSNFNMGPVIHTNRDLDISIAGSGFIAVQSKNGKEAYTRAGDLQIKDGFLKTRNGELVMGNSGPINIGPVEKVNIGVDGTISASFPGGDLAETAINQIKLVNPPLNQLRKGTDGLFYTTDDSKVKPDLNVQVVPETLEGSNVDPVQTLTSLIELSRQFEMHTNMMKTMEDEATKANQLLALAR